MIFFDSRFGTSNTNMAACIAALRIPIKNTDPSYWEENADTGKNVLTYYFETSGIVENDRPVHKCSEIQWAWDNRETFESKQPDHNLVSMRKGLDKLYWLTQVYYGKVKPSLKRSAWNVKTSNIELAAAVMASGYELHSFDSTYRFTVPQKEWNRIRNEFDSFKNHDTATAHIRRVFECRRALIALAKRTPQLMNYSVGSSSPDEGVREGQIHKDAPPHELKKFLDALYE